jgi:prolyl-tRNA editing enzyme YbaK/EbsC (Cys-tRNA(Pro) deacylase)
VAAPLPWRPVSGSRVPATERFLAAAAACGIHVELTRYPEGTRTAADAAAAIGCAVDQIVKSLVFMAADEPVLALTSGAHRVDVGALGTLVGAEVRQANADEVRAATGYAIGGTPPFGHPVPIRTFVDPHLLGFGTVWAAGGTPDSVFPVAPDRLVAVTGAEPASFTT